MTKNSNHLNRKHFKRIAGQRADSWMRSFKERSAEDNNTMQDAGQSTGKLEPHVLFQIYTALVIQKDTIYYR